MSLVGLGGSGAATPAGGRTPGGAAALALTDLRARLLGRFETLGIAKEHLECILGVAPAAERRPRDAQGGEEECRSGPSSVASSRSSSAELLGAAPRQFGDGATPGTSRLRCVEFVKSVTEAFGVTPPQAEDFFHCMDLDDEGEVGLEQWMEALARCPTAFLLKHLRRRVADRHASLRAAFDRQALARVAPDRPLSRDEFAKLLGLLVAVSGSEVDALYAGLASSTGSRPTLGALRAALRETAPWCTLDRIFERLWAEAGGRDAAALLRLATHARDGAQDPRGRSRRRSLSEGARGSEDVEGLVAKRGFDRLCGSLDISSENSAQAWDLAFGRGRTSVPSGEFSAMAERCLPSRPSEATTRC